MMVLLIGADNESGYTRGLADAIRLVRLNFVEGSISTMAFPRDLWVNIPDLNHNAQIDLKNLLGDVNDDQGNPLYPPGDYGKLNVPYFYGDLYGYPGRGPGLLAKTIQVNFGITVEHYVVINMHVFPEIVDAVGGIDIDVPKDIYDTEKGWTFQRGLQHMDGATALQYARTRIADTDWARMGRQDQVIMAFRDRILQADVWPKLPGVIDSVLQNIATDLTRGDIATLTCLVGQTPREQIRNYIIDGSMVTVAHTTTRSYVMLPQPVPIGKMIYQFLYGLAY
jgi:LCP family protein required for cell wall assembly